MGIMGMDAAIAKLMYTETGQIALAVVLGLGLAGIFRTTCGGAGDGSSCVVVTAPPLEKFHGKAYRVGEKCFRYEAKSAEC